MDNTDNKDNTGINSDIPSDKVGDGGIDITPVNGEKNGIKRDKRGRFVFGTTGGAGRTKGKTMKEYARDYLATMPGWERIKFMSALDPTDVWKMAEGNPHQTSDVSVYEKPEPISDVSNNNSDEENKEAPKENPGDTGGNIGQ